MYLSGVKTFLAQNLIIQITFKLVMNLCLLAILLSEEPQKSAAEVAGVTGLEPAASGVTGQRSNQLSYTPTLCSDRISDREPFM